MRSPTPNSPALAHSLLSQPTSVASSISVPKRDVYPPMAEEWACAGPRCSVLRRVGYAAANEQAALRVLGSRTQWPRCAAPVRDRAGEDLCPLPETFIAVGAGLLGFRFRLAGTKI